MDNLDMQLRHSHVILDTCCILNFCVSGYFLDILKSIPAIMTVSEVVKTQELLTLKRVEADDNRNGESDEGPSQFEQAIAQDLLTVVDFESEAEAETFLNYAAEMRDDGESATGAIAFHRNWAIATDDKRAIGFFRRETPHLQILTTPEIIKFWSETAKVSPTDLVHILKNIRKQGNYLPRKSHPLSLWWNKAMGNNK